MELQKIPLGSSCDLRLPQIAALNQLADVVDQFWSEVLENVHLIEALAEDDRFSARELAAFVASKVRGPMAGGVALFLLLTVGAGSASSMWRSMIKRCAWHWWRGPTSTRVSSRSMWRPCSVRLRWAGVFSALTPGWVCSQGNFDVYCTTCTAVK